MFYQSYYFRSEKIYLQYLFLNKEIGIFTNNIIIYKKMEYLAQKIIVNFFTMFIITRVSLSFPTGAIIFCGHRKSSASFRRILYQVSHKKFDIKKR